MHSQGSESILLFGDATETIPKERRTESSLTKAPEKQTAESQPASNDEWLNARALMRLLSGGDNTFF